MTAFTPSQLLAPAAALSTGLVVALVIFRLGRGRFSARLFGVAVASGAALALLPAALGPLVAGLHVSLTPLWGALFMAFGMAGLVEEGTKLAAAWFFVRPRRERRTKSDLVLGVASVALGFALVENVFYLLAAADRWPAAALARMATALPIHALIGLVLGGGLARAEASSGATRAVFVARAWLIAAFLHGLYDFPLFIAARAPLYPVQINEFALAFGTTTPTLLAALYLAAVIAAGVGAARVVISLRLLDRNKPAAAGPTGEWRAPGRSAGQGGPNRLTRLVLARPTGLAVGCLLLIPSAIWIALAVNAGLAGLMPAIALDALSVCAASVALGLMLLLRAAPPAFEAARGAPAAPGVFWRKRVSAAMAVLAVGATILVFGGSIDSARRNLLAQALLVGGNTYSAGGDLDRATRNYDAALLYEPDFVPALIQRAAANRTYQRYPRVLEDLDHAARLAPDDPGILGARADAHENLHQFDEALADLDRALRLRPDDPAFLTLRAELVLNRGDFAEAAAALDHALRLKPDLALAHAVRGDMFLQEVDYPNALRELDEALRLDPGFATAYFTRGRVRYLLGEFPTAAADFAQAAGREPQAYEMLWLFLARERAGQNGRGELIFMAGRLARDAWPFPIVELFAGVRSGPSTLTAATNSDQRCEADFYIAEWLLLQNNVSSAVAGLRAAAAICPKAFIELNAAVAELNRLAPAAAPGATPPAEPPAGAGEPKAGEATQPSALDVGAAASHYALGVYHQRQGRTDEAVAEYRQAVRLDPTRSEAHRSLGEVLKQQGMLDEAVAELRASLRLDPDRPESHELLGDVRLDQREFGDAIAEYGEAVRLSPAEPTPHRLLGQAMLEVARGQGGDEQATRLREACDQFVQGARLAPADPDFPILQGMVEALLAPAAHCPPS